MANNQSIEAQRLDIAAGALALAHGTSWTPGSLYGQQMQRPGQTGSTGGQQAQQAQQAQSLHAKRSAAGRKGAQARNAKPQQAAE